MNRSRPLRLVMAGLIAAALPIGAVLAQSPAPAASPTATPSAVPAPAATPAPAASPVPAPSTSPTSQASPAPSASPTSSASPSPAPSSPPAAAQSPTMPPPAAQTTDPFGEPVTLESKKVVTLKGNSNWPDAFDSLTTAFKTLTPLLEKQGIKPTGNFMVVYTSTDDAGFTFLAEIPVSQDVKNLGKNMSMGQSPEGKSLKFVHRGAYDNIEDLYEAISNHLDEKKLENKDMFVEEYVTDPLKTAEDKLVITIYTLLK